MAFCEKGNQVRAKKQPSHQVITQTMIKMSMITQ